MSSGAMQSKVGNSQVYENGDQRNAPSTHQSQLEKPADLGQKNAHDIHDPKDNRNLDQRMQQELKEERDSERRDRERTVTDPLEAAQSHGNKPSRGAQIDAELQREDEELIRKKDAASQ
ncbi:uncharacterized protein TRAVEDRAFT_110483 [Trametes versicolor FP-101664 SS1]|uniref:uncharacterized protein n=1 Tax=Trametes versicolor (strain FP-101664) TaxID=717944 RepID=UPI000462443B|nr:uncharacterized protein TRAVEDRAFT_110483 [Trametes versicolor FP-101664 SS1]EIW63873.1 hypothetical protein TRAVEDRAFT_110483 [Trametes versicolor FP-101664 SS1]